ncbi:MAG TPA: pyrroloquinoline quinone biosynthesis protein PqqB, partial [Terriglobales bacterium]|nr:pyrroloquinoline quinone biosynthesis protein PqqB [Terriglobales bacterium]
MHVKILGSAAGGGFPQWNCACSNCRLLRSGTLPGKARSQTQVAISHDGLCWFLLGASPDLRSQIEACPDLQPRDRANNSPLCGVVLASADLDHILGLLLLRELQPLNVYATASVIHILRDQNSMFSMLNRTPDQVRWQAITPGESFQLCNPSGQPSGITCTSISISTRYPVYVSDSDPDLNPEDAALALMVTSDSGRVLVYAPTVAAVTQSLRDCLEIADLLLFDGTFYSDDELIRVRGSGERAREMGHLPVGGENGSLRQFAGLKVPHKLYIHINNTNPMLNETTP